MRVYKYQGPLGIDNNRSIYNDHNTLGLCVTNPKIQAWNWEILLNGKGLNYNNNRDQIEKENKFLGGFKVAQTFKN